MFEKTTTPSPRRGRYPPRVSWKNVSPPLVKNRSPSGAPATRYSEPTRSKAYLTEAREIQTGRLWQEI